MYLFKVHLLKIHIHLTFEMKEKVNLVTKINRNQPY